MCEKFLFTGNQQYSPIGKLSGGEKRRLYLLKILMTAPNVLILDEPTNDLDIMTLTILEDYLQNFEGIIIAVSHDRYFLDKLVKRIFVFRGNGVISQVEGNYTDYREKELSNLEEAAKYGENGKNPKEGKEAGEYAIHVSQEEGSNPKYNITFAEGTFRIGDVIHHDVTEPTYETVGFLQECWEDRTFGKYYSDAACSQELDPAQVTYAKFITNPVTAIYLFNTPKDVTYDGVQFNWAAETTYTTWQSYTRYVEFTVLGTDVNKARLKWTKTCADARYGTFDIAVYVNNEQVYMIKKYGGADLFVVPLQGLKTGDIVRFEVKLAEQEYAGSVTIAACLEYTSSNGGLNGMLITANQDPDHTENYYSTFWSSTAAYQVPEGVTAYTGKVEDSTSEPNTSVLKLTAIKDGIIPASQGVILRMTTEDNSATKQQIALAKTTATGTWSGTNALTGTDEATTLGANQYALSLGQRGVGFYLWEGKSIGEHKAYLTLSKDAIAKVLTFVFDDGSTTGIGEASPISSPASTELSTDSEKDFMYDLNGVRVNDSYKGIVIKNGKKVLKK